MGGPAQTRGASYVPAEPDHGNRRNGGREMDECMAHHWNIETAEGPTSKGVCRRCGETRTFNNAPVEQNEGMLYNIGRGGKRLTPRGTISGSTVA